MGMGSQGWPARNRTWRWTVAFCSIFSAQRRYWSRSAKLLMASRASMRTNQWGSSSKGENCWASAGVGVRRPRAWADQARTRKS